MFQNFCEETFCCNHRLSLCSHFMTHSSDHSGMTRSSKKNDDDTFNAKNSSAYMASMAVDFFFIVVPLLLIFTVSFSDWVLKEHLIYFYMPAWFMVLDFPHLMISSLLQLIFYSHLLPSQSAFLQDQGTNSLPVITCWVYFWSPDRYRFAWIM